MYLKDFSVCVILLIQATINSQFESNQARSNSVVFAKIGDNTRSFSKTQMGTLIDLTGKTFSKLTVLSRAENKGGRVIWLCKCSCGEEKEVKGNNLNTGHTKSCGCLQREAVTERNTTHGGSGTLEYKSWLHMKTRCSDPNYEFYADYGGRGIKVCDRWVNSFENFLEDMGSKPTDDHSLGRQLVDGNYEPGNVSWETPLQQARSKRTSVIITWDNRTQCLMDWARELSPILGVSVRTINGRVKRGWSVEKAFTLKNIKAYKVKTAA